MRQDPSHRGRELVEDLADVERFGERRQESLEGFAPATPFPLLPEKAVVLERDPKQSRAYVLLAHLLYQPTLDAAIEAAKRGRHAGWFTFVMADGSGRLLNVEGSPEGVACEEAERTLFDAIIKKTPLEQVIVHTLWAMVLYFTCVYLDSMPWYYLWPLGLLCAPVSTSADKREWY